MIAIMLTPTRVTPRIDNEELLQVSVSGGSSQQIGTHLGTLRFRLGLNGTR